MMVLIENFTLLPWPLFERSWMLSCNSYQII